MNETIDIPSEAVVVRQNMAVGQAMGVQEIIAQVKLIQEVMGKVMTDGEHYGTIPGCGEKKTLLQPGAQKLTMTFRLAPSYEIQESDLPRGHKEYRVVCTLKSIVTGTFVGQGVGVCSSMESKYRFRGGARKCPKCGKEAIIMGKKFKPTDPEPGWLCWKRKEGCGATWPVGSQEIEGQSIEKIENENPADTFNTVLKMAKKRAFVDATITATAASDIFTQDVGDEEAEHPEAPKMPQDEKGGIKVAAKSETPTLPVAGKASGATIHPQATPETRQKLIEKLMALQNIGEEQILEYFRKLDNPTVLLPTEGLLDLPLEFVPVTQKQFEALKVAIVAFTEGSPVKHAFPPNPVAPPAPAAKPIEVPRDKETVTPEAVEAWRTFPMPWGKQAGVPLGDLEKNYLFGLWANFKVELEYNGKPKKPETIAKDKTFRKMLDDAGAHYEFKHKD